jgi:peroxiredoxin
MLAVKQEPEPLLLLVDDSEKIEVSGVIGNPISSYTLNGSEGTSLVQGLNARLKGAVQTIDSLSKHFRNSREHIKFDSISTAIDSLYLKTISDHKQYTVNFIHKNRYSLASILALYQQYDKNSPVLAKREDFELFKLVDSTLYPLYPHNSLVENLHKNVGMIGKQFSLFDRRRDMLTEGQTLPDIDLPMLDGDTLKLSQIKGKLILIDFWALWCNDCQANNRKLMDIYSRFSGKGFQVVQVSLDLKTAALPAKIKNLGIEWPIVADFQQWDSPILEAMSINSIPSNYLIDSKRVIKAQNINPKELEEVLGKLLP